MVEGSKITASHASHTADGNGKIELVRNSLQSPLDRQILWIISAMILCIAAPLLFHEATGGWSNERSPWWSLAIIMVAGAMYAGVIASPSRHLFGMVLWLFTYLFMGVAPYVQYRLDATLSTIPHINPELYPIAGTLVLVCCGALAVGSIMAGRSGRPLQALPITVVDRRRTNILSAAAIALFLYYGSQVGFGSFLLTRTEGSAYREGIWGDSVIGALLGGSMRMALLVTFLAQMALRRQDKARGRRPKLLPAFLLGVLMLYVVNPINSPRYIFGAVILGMLAAFGVYATLHKFRVMAVAAMAGLLFVFPLADAFRHSTDATIEIEGPVKALTSGDFDAFAQLANTFDYIAAHDITYGGQLLGVLFLWVPRSLWPGKPEATGTLIAEHMGYQFTNISSPIWAELLINFGWVGAILGMGFLGYLFNRWDAQTEAHLRRYPMPPVVVSATAFYMLIFLRGSLLAVSAQLFVILLASWFVTRRSPSVGRPGTTRVTAQTKELTNA